MTARLPVSDLTRVCSTSMDVKNGHRDERDCYHHANIIRRLWDGRYLVKSHFGYVRAFDPDEIKIQHV